MSFEPAFLLMEFINTERNLHFYLLPKSAIAMTEQNDDFRSPISEKQQPLNKEINFEFRQD